MKNKRSIKNFKFLKSLSFETKAILCLFTILSLIAFISSGMSLPTLSDIKTTFIVFVGTIFTFVVFIPVCIYNFIIHGNILGLVLFLWLIDKFYKDCK